ncbi:hypothetical protein GUJ93_ZPchr0006g45971 [Zizania palustris]|uniref:Uncharacterized protein n=1 Tax=Zizania palustris TaxID=103762 RepID=A0A8J5TAU9_ZIZPA|nr:hypothetical protein GUJ93_ZPchr0006g45971 [Zizania palustris]
MGTSTPPIVAMMLLRSSGGGHGLCPPCSSLVGFRLQLLRKIPLLGPSPPTLPALPPPHQGHAAATPSPCRRRLLPRRRSSSPSVAASSDPRRPPGPGRRLPHPDAFLPFHSQCLRAEPPKGKSATCLDPQRFSPQSPSTSTAVARLGGSSRSTAASCLGGSLTAPGQPVLHTASAVAPSIGGNHGAEISERPPPGLLVLPMCHGPNLVAIMYKSNLCAICAYFKEHRPLHCLLQFCLAPLNFSLVFEFPMNKATSFTRTICSIWAMTMLRFCPCYRWCPSPD